MRYVLLLILAGSMLTYAQPSRAVEEPPAALRGTFLQLTRANAEWPNARWELLFDRFRALSLTDVIVQWSVYDDLAFYESDAVASAPQRPLHTILRLADRAGMRVLVGLAHDSQYWSRIERSRPLVEVYLRRQRLKATSVATELAPRVRQHPSFAGWYLTQELDDVNWRDRASWQMLVSHVAHLSGSLRKLTPGARIAMSGFSNGRIDPERLAADWGQLAETAKLDAMLFQDGIGVAKLRLEDLEPYFAALQQTLRRPGQFQVILETFTQTGGPPVTAGGFTAEPAPVERVRRQLEVARRYTSGPLIAFSVPEYMTPEAGSAGGRLFEAYRARAAGQ